ncbi:MAG: hypothetical protein KF778_01075 [Rhodocyclaceae bacterium]|nr:hypothetical protein [Rhodocyclaceae bacterium]MBX3666972.1 hypothetical protein [Rhodocyclaceae bacterium]
MCGRQFRIAFIYVCLAWASAAATAGEAAPGCENFEQVLAAARDKNADACVQLALWYAGGTCTGADAGQALDWAHRGADLGSAAAMQLLARWYASGQGVAVDAAAAERWNRRAREAAAAEIRSPVAQPPATANKPAQQAPAAPDDRAQILAAEVRYGMSLLGHAKSEDFRTAIEVLERAIARGYARPDAWAGITWAALHLGDYERVIAAAAQVPRDAAEFPAADINRAHALAANGQVGNARVAYEANRELRGEAEFRRVLAQDYAQLRRAGMDYPGFRRIEQIFLAAPADPEQAARSAKPARAAKPSQKSKRTRP